MSTLLLDADPYLELVEPSSESLAWFEASLAAWEPDSTSVLAQSWMSAPPQDAAPEPPAWLERKPGGQGEGWVRVFLDRAEAEPEPDSRALMEAFL